MALSRNAQAITDKADSELGGWFEDAVAMQNSYLAANGRYWQGIRTQDAPPRNGESGNPDYSRKPTDQSHDWIASGAKDVMPDPPNTRVAVDVYDGPQGQGWVLRMDFVSGEVRYIKAVNHGPETWHSHDWREVSNGPV